MGIGIEERKLVIEIVATLVHIKRTMADLILKPAGVPLEIIRPLLFKRDEITGRSLSKRQIAPLILNEIEKSQDSSIVVRRIIKIASNWNNFHLAEDEYIARATVQKARELFGTIELMGAREAKQREIARIEEIAKLEKERAERFKKELGLLLLMFDELALSNNPQRRGYLLENLLNRIFDLHEIPVTKSFTRNDGAEQIDGAFKLEGWHYLAECKWTEGLSNTRELDSLYGKIDRSGKQTMGLFLSVNGWSDNVPKTMKQNSQKSIVLMDGYDIRCVLCGQIDLHEFLFAKLARLNLACEPFYGAREHLEDIKNEK